MAASLMTTSFSELRPTRTVPSRIRCRVPARRPDLRTSHAFRSVVATEGKYSRTRKKEPPAGFSSALPVESVRQEFKNAQTRYCRLPADQAGERRQYSGHGSRALLGQAAGAGGS